MGEGGSFFSLFEGSIGREEERTVEVGLALRPTLDTGVGVLTAAAAAAASISRATFLSLKRRKRELFWGYFLLPEFPDEFKRYF